VGLDDMTAWGNEKWQTIFFKDEHFTADLCLIFMLVFLRTETGYDRFNYSVFCSE